MVANQNTCRELAGGRHSSGVNREPDTPRNQPTWQCRALYNSSHPPQTPVPLHHTGVQERGAARLLVRNKHPRSLRAGPCGLPGATMRHNPAFNCKRGIPLHHAAPAQPRSLFQANTSPRPGNGAVMCRSGLGIVLRRFNAVECHGALQGIRNAVFMPNIQRRRRTRCSVDSF